MVGRVANCEGATPRAPGPMDEAAAIIRPMLEKLAGRPVTSEMVGDDRR